MSEQQLTTPVALFIYKRPQHTERVLRRIRQAAPPLLFVVADGPREESERSSCNRTRDLVTDGDFPFEVRTNFASENLGLQERFSTGLEWVFSNTSEAIILEDDTVPAPSFFYFCDTLLKHYRGDERIWDITGTNHHGKWERDGYDYHYSLYGSIWGWATWRDSWKQYDAKMELWDSEIVRDRIRDVISDPDQYRYARKIYDKVRDGDLNTWDYQWGFARHRNNGLSVVPYVNLVENVGFEATATNTSSPSDLQEKNTFEVSPPLDHPPFVAPDREYDRRLHQLRQNRMKPRRILDALRNAIGF